MKKTMAMIFSVAIILGAAIGCGEVRVPTEPPADTATPNPATATAIAQTTQTAIALQTAGPAAQQSATADAAIILSQTKTTTPTSYVTPTRTATVTPTLYVEHGFRLVNLTAYNDGVIQSSGTFSYGTGATPTSATADYYSFGALSGHSDIVFDFIGNTMGSITYDEFGAVIASTDAVMSGGKVIRLNARDAGGNIVNYQTFQYDSYNRPVRQEVFNAADVSQGYILFQYDAANRVTRQDQYDGSGNYVTGKGWTYNASGVVTREDFYNSGGALGQYNIYTINAQGKQASGIVYNGSGTPVGTITITYDGSWNMLTAVMYVDSGGGNWMQMAVVWTYDANNNISSITTGFTSNTSSSPVMYITMTWEEY